MLFKSNSRNRSFSDLTTQLHDFTLRKNQSFRTKLKSSEILEKSKKLIKFIYKTFKRSTKTNYKNLPEMKVSHGIEAVQIREEYPDIDNVIRGIILTHSQNGATIEDIKNSYYSLEGVQIPYMSDTVEFIMSIPNIFCQTNEMGTKIFFAVPNDKNQHLFEMIVNQKMPKERMRTARTRGFFGNNREDKGFYKTNITSHAPRANDINPGHRRVNGASPKISLSSHSSEYYFEPRETFYEDNYKYLQSRFNCETSSTSSANRRMAGSSSEGFHQSISSLNTSYGSIKRRRSEYLRFQKRNGYLMDRFQLISDDFMLYLAKMELGCQFNPGRKVYQSGLCISGQTISDATLRVSNVESLAPYVIINIGSVDIMNGKPLVRMESDAIRLTEAIRARNSIPIWTSLAPLGNYNHQPQIAEKVKKFNGFLERTMHENYYIDISGRVKSSNGKILYDCYQPAPRMVTGSKHPHLFWNKIGRQRILKHIEECIEIS